MAVITTLASVPVSAAGSDPFGQLLQALDASQSRRFAQAAGESELQVRFQPVDRSAIEGTLKHASGRTLIVVGRRGRRHEPMQISRVVEVSTGAAAAAPSGRWQELKGYRVVGDGADQTVERVDAFLKQDGKDSGGIGTVGLNEAWQLLSGSDQAKFIVFERPAGHGTFRQVIVLPDTIRISISGESEDAGRFSGTSTLSDGGDPSFSRSVLPATPAPSRPKAYNPLREAPLEPLSNRGMTQAEQAQQQEDKMQKEQELEAMRQQMEAERAKGPVPPQPVPDVPDSQ